MKIFFSYPHGATANAAFAKRLNIDMEARAQPVRFDEAEIKLPNRFNNTGVAKNGT